MRVKALAAVLLLAGAAAVSGQSPEGIYISGGGIMGLYTGGDTPFPMPGFRLAGGYALPCGPGAVLLGAETGYSSGFSARGGSFGLVPLALTAAYRHPAGAAASGTGLALEGGLSLGGMAVLTQGRAAMTPLIGARIRAALGKGDSPWELYAGGGADLMPEPAGLSVFPTLELGLRWRPSNQ